MAEPKTKNTEENPKDFISRITDERVRKDSLTLLKLIREVTGEKPAMWGSSIVGYGMYTYKYASGHGGDWPITGFSPRKQNLTVYVMTGRTGMAPLLKKLGKCKTAKSCLYIKKLEDVDLEVLKQIVRKSYEETCRKYGV
jgi:hypothetical protein